MASVTLAQILLWLFVITLGIAFGAGLYEHRIVVSRWVGVSPDGAHHWDAAAARRDDTGRRFWAFVTTGPLTLLGVACLIVASKAHEPVRTWWLAASVAALADRLVTFSYFIPSMIRLMNAPDEPASAARALRWSTVNYVRHALVLTAWLAALNAFALLYRYG
jgi:hypothetical protein